MNEKAKIYICTHTDFDCPVSNPVYQILDSRKLFEDDKAPNGIDALFYSEILSYSYLADRPYMLPDIVGFCGYRKYFAFLDDVPDLEGLVRKYGCIATTPRKLKWNVYNQYAHHFSFADLDVMKAIIRCKQPDLWPTFNRMLQGDTLYTCNMFVMQRSDFLSLMHLVWQALNTWLDVCGYDLQQRILLHQDIYFKNGGRGATIPNQIRMGGHLAERITSAYIAHYFPHCKTYDIHVTEKARPRKTI